MIRFLYKFLYNIKGTKLKLAVYRIVKIFLNIFYPIYCILIKKYKHKATINNIIVSLTSFPARINSLWIVIETLLRQTYRPEKIILWLAYSQFESENRLPKKLIKLRERGLEIKFCDDLRSHKKYYYTIKEYPEYDFITVDDDTFYPEDLVESLILTSKKYPNTVCCNLAHLITVKNGQIKPYSEWISDANGYDEPSDYLVPIGCEGVFYPSRSLNENVLNKSKIIELSPFADDLWLKSMSTLNGVKAVKTKPTSIAFANMLSPKSSSSLHTINVQQNMNDKQLNNIIGAYPELKEIWK